jgi:outer membrane immunogenic protein
MNSALLFATGGWAYGRNKITTSGTLTDAVSGASLSFTNASSKSMSGWTLGSGVEYAFMQNVTAKLEYLYADLGTSTFSAGEFGSTPVSNTVSIIRAGVNYRF